VCVSALGRRYAASDSSGRGSSAGGIHNTRALGNGKSGSTIFVTRTQREVLKYAVGVPARS